MNLSDRGRAMLKAEESLVLHAYDDKDPKARPVMPGDKVKGTLTIGWGHTGPDVIPGMGINEAAAEGLLTKDIAKAERIVNTFTETHELTFNQHEYDALVLFAMNNGSKPFVRETGFSVALRHHRWKVPSIMLLYNKSKGKVMAGLTARRSREAHLFRSGRYPQDGAPAPPPTLRRGDRGPEVKRLQQGLARLNLMHDHEDTGFFGDDTDRAVRTFQREADLTPDGIVGKLTHAALTAALAAKEGKG